MGVNLSLRVKLFTLVLAVLIGFGGAISLYVTTHVADDLNRELLKRGESIARHLAETSTEAFIEDDHLSLQYLAKEHQRTENDIRYIVMLDRNNQVIAHSFGATFPIELADVNRYHNGQTAHIRRLDIAGDIVYDIAVPVLDGRVGSLRIGLSADQIRTGVATLTRDILLTILAFGVIAFLLTLPAAQAIARPLASLTRAIEGLSKGRRDLQLPIGRRDEIGCLNNAFNQMASDVRLAEKRLAAQINFLQVLMEGLPVPVFYKDCSLKMLGCNPNFAAFWGKDSAEIIGRTPEELYSAPEASLHSAKDREALAGGQTVVYETTVTDASGKAHDIIFHKAMFRDEDGDPAGIIGVMHDVTEQREAGRMKNEFFSTVAHEFQTPLATILGFSEMLQCDQLGGEDRQEALRMIVQKAERLSQMVDELLDLARLESGRSLSISKEPCDLRELVRESVEGFRLRLATHQFDLDMPPAGLPIEADAKRLGQVIENLLSNAVKYSPPDSTVHVSLRSHAGICQIDVRDEGRGMTPNQLEHLFDKFYRVDTSKGTPRGTGLGLFIVKSIVVAHGGTIHISSAAGKGTTVSVKLPCGRPD